MSKHILFFYIFCITVKICRQGKYLTFRPISINILKCLHQNCFALIFKFKFRKKKKKKKKDLRPHIKGFSHRSWFFNKGEGPFSRVRISIFLRYQTEMLTLFSLYENLVKKKKKWKKVKKSTCGHTRQI